MNSLIQLFLFFIIGLLLYHSRRMKEHTPITINKFIIYVSLPALTLLNIHKLNLSVDVVLMASMAWIFFVIAIAFFWLVGRWLKLQRGTVGALILTGGIGNTSFIGLPMIDAYYGQEGIVTGIIVSQLGSFLVLSTLGVTVAGIYSSRQFSVVEMLQRIMYFPPFIALVMSLALIPLEYPSWFTSLLDFFGATLAPLALLSIGYQLRLGHLMGHWRNLSIGLGFKMLLAPLLIYFIYVQVVGAHGKTIQVTLFEAAMPPMITASIIAIERGLDPELSTLMVAVGMILSFATLNGWWWVLQGI